MYFEEEHDLLLHKVWAASGEQFVHASLELLVVCCVDERVDTTVAEHHYHSKVIKGGREIIGCLHS